MNIHDNFVTNGLSKKSPQYLNFPILIHLPYVAMFLANRGLHKYINASLYYTIQYLLFKLKNILNEKFYNDFDIILQKDNFFFF